MKNKCVLFFGAMRNIEYLDKNKTIKKKKNPRWKSFYSTWLKYFQSMKSTKEI